MLKRKPGTPRGGGQWVTIDFNVAINEIVEGGDLFGEGHVQGLKEVCVLRDRSVAKAMSEDVAKIKKKSMTVEEFKSKHSAQLNTLHRPRSPGPGPQEQPIRVLGGPHSAWQGRTYEMVYLRQLWVIKLLRAHDDL